jgi:hypothetical protein
MRGEVTANSLCHSNPPAYGSQGRFLNHMDAAARPGPIAILISDKRSPYPPGRAFDCYRFSGVDVPAAKAAE